jgi:hypothetical protein
MFKRFHIQIEHLPKPISTFGFAYVSGLIGYNIFGTYVDARNALKEYRQDAEKFNTNKGLSGYYMVKNDWDAVKFGAYSNSFERLWDSIVCPITSITNVIPAIVLYFNPKSN